MFKTSHVVYLVIVFFLMRHFKVFNMIDKKTKIKDKNYLLAFTFAVLLFGAHVLEMLVNELLKRFPMLKLPGFMDDKIYVDVPIVEGHAPLCTMKYGAEGTPIDSWTAANRTTTENTTAGNGPADPEADCIYNLGDVPEGESRWRHRDGTSVCGCDPSTAQGVDAFRRGNDDLEIDSNNPRTCTESQLEVGICSAAAEQASSGPGDDSLTCCHSQKVTNYYAYLQGLWELHGEETIPDGHIELRGDIAETQYGDHRSTQIAAIAGRIAGDLNLGTYTVPGRGGGGGGGNAPVIEPLSQCNNNPDTNIDGYREDCAWDARLAADGSPAPVPEGQRVAAECPTPCVFVQR